jgi:hypothetical protein
MERCDKNGVDFNFGLPGNAELDRAVVATYGFSIEDLRAPERWTYQLHLPTRPPLRLEAESRRGLMDGVVIARALHVLGVVIWIGGVAMVTMVVLPAVALVRLISPVAWALGGRALIASWQPENRSVS